MLLLKLPYLVQLEILKNLEVYEQFFLGLCSRRAKNVVQVLRQNFEETVINVKNFLVHVKKTEERRGRDIVMWASTCYRPENEHLIPKIEERDRKITFRYRQTKIRCGFNYHPTRRIPIVWCKDRHKRMISLALHHAICDVFNLSHKIQVIFSMDQFSEFPDTDFVDNLRENSYKTENPVYSMFFEKLQIRNFADIGSWEVENLGPAHRIFSTPHLYLTGFINNWKNGETENLEFMRITLGKPREVFDNDKIWENFEGRPWDPTKRGQRFKNTPIIKSGNKFDLLDCTQQLDIQRESDGLLATVIIRDNTFFFLVWQTAFPDPFSTESETYTSTIRQPIGRRRVPPPPVQQPERVWSVGTLCL